MKKQLTLPDGESFHFRVASDVLRRLNLTCFGALGGKPFAGKFARWPNIETMLANKMFLAVFLKEADSLFGEITGTEGSFVRRVTLRMPEPIGWDTTAPRGGFGTDELDQYDLNMMTGGLIVKADSPRKAPLTDLITLACHVSRSWGQQAIEIYGMNPGFDIGWISASNGEGGNVTEKTGRVFFAFDHPGEEPAVAA
jgi:hypothetical protein